MCELIYQEAKETQAQFHGLDGREFRRMPLGIAGAVSETVAQLSQNTSGGRIRFTTGSARLGIRLRLQEVGKMPHMPLSGSSSADVYLEGKVPRYIGTIRPGYGEDTAQGELALPGGLQGITVYLPLYNGVEGLDIGVEPGASVQPPAPIDARDGRPVVFYGSSITQGGCASRPANSYPAMLSRSLGFDFLNLGFSGNAKGEPEMAAYIAGLPMRCFVYDYDHNAPDGEFLRNTHLPFLQQILSRQPDLPVILVTRPDPVYSEEDYRRREAVLATYEWAVSQGLPSSQIQFADGWMMFGTTGRDCCTVDGCHPNDLGFYRMAEYLYPYLNRVIRM